MSSGTDEAVADPITDEQAARHWAVVDAHALVDGDCRTCRTPGRCWVRAGAVARLIVTGRWDQPRPA